MKIHVLARVLRCDFDKQVAKLNVTRSQWTMIGTVAQLPGATQRMIADALEMSEASAGRLIDKLCTEGLLERRARKDDRRARAVNLTETSEPLLENLATIGEQYEENMFAGFDEEDLDRMRGYLDRIYKNIGQCGSGGYNNIDELYRSTSVPVDA